MSKDDFPCSAGNCPYAESIGGLKTDVAHIKKTVDDIQDRLKEGDTDISNLKLSQARRNGARQERERGRSMSNAKLTLIIAGIMVALKALELGIERIWG